MKLRKKCEFMPNISSHMAVAKRVQELLKINNDDFYRGNVLPDLYDDKVKSHYRIKGTRYSIPDIKRVKQELDLNKPINLGILTHLLLDKYYLEEYLINIEENVFYEKKVYNDYDVLNKEIINHFQLDIDYIYKILNNFPNDIPITKLELIKKCLKIDKEGNTLLLEKNKFINFLENTSIKISKEINSLMK